MNRYNDIDSYNSMYKKKTINISNIWLSIITITLLLMMVFCVFYKFETVKIYNSIHEDDLLAFIVPTNEFSMIIKHEKVVIAKQEYVFEVMDFIQEKDYFYVTIKALNFSSSEKNVAIKFILFNDTVFKSLKNIMKGDDL